MRAAFCIAPRTIELREVPWPAVLPGEVVVRVHACGLCGSDLHYYTGAARPPDVCLGHEICGEVVDGPSAIAGTPVVVEPLLACGTCTRCRAGEPNLCPRLRILGSLAPGGLADAVAVPRSCVYPVPERLDLDTAMLAEPLAVGVHAARLADLNAGDEALVLGAGTIGLLAAFVLARGGARVTVSARHAHQRTLALALGATHVIGDVRDETVEAGTQRPPDLVVETVGGTADTLDLALEVVRPGGRIVALGKFTRPIALPPLRFLMKEVHLVSSMTYSRRPPRPDFATALALLAAERDRLAPVITHRVSLADVARGFALATDKTARSVKIAVAPDASSGT
jgi:2-desacetyl-2-hydroxyethyl bacteriochlorophyllide A dehydrogenase